MLNQTDAAYEAARRMKVKEVAKAMKDLTIQEVASRTVVMLIHDEGNLNRYQASLEFMLECFELSRATGSVEETPNE